MHRVLHASLGDVKTGKGPDLITVLDGARIGHIHSKGGDDIIQIGAGVTANKGHLHLDGDDSHDCLRIDLGVDQQDFETELLNRGWGKTQPNYWERGQGSDDFHWIAPSTGTDLHIKEKEVIEFSAVNCFCEKTVILTSQGEIPVEALKVGQLVKTRDNGFQSIKWIGKRKVSTKEAEANPTLRPIVIFAGTMGNNLPKRDLKVSRQHRMLIASPITKRMFEKDEVLVAAIKLTKHERVSIVEDATSVTYYHLLFNHHQVIYAEGAPSESLLIGPETMTTISIDSRREITTLFPELANSNHGVTSDYFIPSNKLQNKLVSRHIKNNKPFITSRSELDRSSSVLECV